MSPMSVDFYEDLHQLQHLKDELLKCWDSVSTKISDLSVSDDEHPPTPAPQPAIGFPTGF
jgi:hypothetical protein